MSFKPKNSKKGLTYEQMTLRQMAREDTHLYLSELKRIALGRVLFDEQLIKLNEGVKELTLLLKRRKMDGHEAVSSLQDLLDEVGSPPDQANILKAIDMMLMRGWGRPATESVDYMEFLDIGEGRAASMVKAALIAKAMAGDVSAQQAVLRLPTQIEISGIGEDELDASLLSEEDLALFLSLVEKMKGTPEGVNPVSKKSPVKS